MTLRHMPYAIPHDQHGAGLRDYLPIATTPGPGSPWAWAVLIVFLTFVFGVWCGSRVHAASCISLRVRPGVMLQRSDVTIETRIARHADHRRLAVSWASDNGKDGGFQVSLDGDQAPAFRSDVVRDMPPANYALIAAVYDTRGKMIARESAEIRTVEVIR